jgi:uncharacterized protein (TIGR03437 family)
VNLNGVPVAYSSSQNDGAVITYAVPGGTIPQSAVLSLACNGAMAWAFDGLNSAAAVPGLFTSGASGQATSANADGTTNSSVNPAAREGYITLYGTGFGAYNASGANGLKTLAGSVTATVGGIPATVVYAGNAPGESDAVQQFNVQVPATASTDSAVPVVVSVNGTPSQAGVTIAVH